MKKIWRRNKKYVVASLLGAFTFMTAGSFFLNEMTVVHAASVSEIKAAYQEYLTTYTGTTPETDFIKYIENGDAKYFSNGGYILSKDKLSEEGVAMVQEVFGITEENLLTNGGTIGSANGEKWSGSYVSTSANGVSAGGASIEDGDFSIIVMGDQQTAVEYHSAMVASTYDWIVENAEAMNLKMYINVGDIVDDTDFVSWRAPSGNPFAWVNFNPGRLGNSRLQQEFAITQAEKLLTAGIPSAFTMGNHDYSDMAESYRIKENFLKYFTFDKFSTEANGFGGSLYNDIEAAWYEFEANGQKYMTIVLGCYPTTEILNWANEVVSSHPDHKVIVSTHSYLNGASYDLMEEGAVIWDTFVSQHENIFLLVSGHECTEDGSIIKKVDFGANGNAVTQLMINPQIEEFGGAGTIAQLIFRADGSVDLVYYSPYAAEHNNGKGYFMDENQFTFSLNPEQITITATEFENQIVTDENAYTDATSICYKYFGHDKKETGVQKIAEGVYAYSNALFTERGFTSQTAEAAYVVHKLYAGDYSVFRKMSVSVDGEFLDDRTGAYQIDLSSDGINYQTALYCNAETGTFRRAYTLDRFACGGEYLYIRVLAKNATVSKLTLIGDSVKTVFTDKTFNITYNFSNSIGETSFEEWNMEGAYSKYHVVLSGNILGSGANGRMSSKSYVTYRFDSGEEKRYFTNFSVDFQFKAQYLLSNAEGYTFSQKEGLDYILELLISIDGGKTFIPIKQFTEADCGVSADNPVKTFWVNETLLSDRIIEEKFDGVEVTSFILKIAYFGAGPQRAHAGLYNLNLSGSLNKAMKEEEDKTTTKTFVLNGGYFENKNSVLPKRSGYEFKGWYLNEDFSGNSVNPDDYSNNGNYTFYAKWTRGYYITYVLDGGVNSVKNVNIINEGTLVSLLAAEKEGKTFVGWYDANGKKYETLKGSELDGDLVLYAVWKDAKATGCSSAVNADIVLIIVLSAIFVGFVAIKKSKKV